MSDVDYRYEYLSGGFMEMVGALFVTVVNAGQSAGSVRGWAYRGRQLVFDSAVNSPNSVLVDGQLSADGVVPPGGIWLWEVPLTGQDQISYRVVLRTTAKTLIPAIEFLYLDDNGHTAPRGFCWANDFVEVVLPERVVPPVKPVGSAVTE